MPFEWNRINKTEDNFVMEISDLISLLESNIDE